LPTAQEDDHELASPSPLAAGTCIRRKVHPAEAPRRQDHDRAPAGLNTGARVARDVVERYRDLRIGLADASLVVTAERHRTRRLLTFDERAFRAVTPLQGGAFTLLPGDSR
jgi:predicted nucleic acid-binding protein